MELRIPIPFTRKAPEDIIRRIKRLDNQLKSIGMPSVYIESDGGKIQYTLSQLTGKSTSLDLRTVQGQAAAYNVCPPLNAVVNRWLRAASNAVWQIVDDEGTPVTPAGSPLPELMTRPNPIQSWQEFILQTGAMMRVHGQAFWYLLRPVGMRGVKAIWCIPNYMVTETLTGKFLKETKIEGITTGYEVNYGGTIVPVTSADMAKVKDSSVNFYAGAAATQYSYGNSITDGQSRLYPMTDVINSIIAAYTAKKTTIVNRGPLGMLVSEGGGNIMQVPLSTEEETELYTKFRRAYGTQEGQRQEIISKTAMKWVQITKDIKALMLFEEVEAGTREICAVMDYPFELLGYGAGASLAGGGKFLELKKMLYTDSVIPGTEAIGQALTALFLQPGQHCTPFFDHLDIFQRSRKDDADAMKSYNDACKIAVEAGAMTLEQWKKGLEAYL